MSCARKRFVGCCIHTSIVIRDSLTPVARYGPDSGSLEVHTYREGVAAKVGHDLIIEVTKWAASDDGGMLELTADPRSLVVREGNRGVKPLTDKDRASIQKTIEKDILGAQEITFASNSVEGGASRATSRSPGARSPSSSTCIARASACGRRSRSSRPAGASSPTAASWAR